MCHLDGGLDELTDELSSGKMLYAGLKVIDPNTSLPKYVLINWVCIFLHLVNFSENNHEDRTTFLIPPLFLVVVIHDNDIKYY